ncbi:hypothetical protein SRB5_08690 [Streptomyces sp. RB5]|uniref:Recombinase n=1 Tax=Streptomyces smaragdinus TaxID=2585196 RepID=A0A7K0CBH0_9ACTN|nr:endonuclease domain-containing protein [Streptomyces smaragdinus]MQY10756.1 hypothetical protein [Streptomyces smaragdinus]
MSERAESGRTDGLITLAAADALWVELTTGSDVPTASGALTRSPACAGTGYVLLGSRVVTTARGSVPEAEVRRAAAVLNAVAVDRRDLVRVGPFHAAPGPEREEGTPLRWRRRIAEEPGGPEAVRDAHHLAGIDWRQLLVDQTRDGTRHTWWLPRAVVRLLDAAEHAEAVRTRRTSAAVTEQTRAADRRADPAGPVRPYNKELEGQLYSALSRKPGTARKVAGWACAVCRTAPATVLDHCHEHGYVRAPVCQSCNTQERPDHLYDNDIRVANRYTRLFESAADAWLHHWHRCTGCRARTTLPLPHLAAWTAHTACRPLRPTHPTAGGREPCGVLRVSWTGNQNTPRSCLLTVSVDFCPAGEHRVLAQVAYREAADRFRTWLAETAPTVAAAAGPSRLETLPTRFRPVVADTSGGDLELF